MAAVAHGDQVLFAGGGNVFFDFSIPLIEYTTHDSVDVFEPATGTWTVEQLSVARNGLVAADLGDRVVFGCGTTPDDNVPSGYSKSGAVDVRTLGLWTDLGKATAGAQGVPVLSGAGKLAGGSAATLTLSNAAPGALAWMVLGFAQIDVPLLGGTLVPAPSVIFSPLPANGAGQLQLPLSLAAGVPAGFTTYWQIWILDGTGPAGFTASNGLAGVTQ